MRNVQSDPDPLRLDPVLIRPDSVSALPYFCRARITQFSSVSGSRQSGQSQVARRIVAASTLLTRPPPTDPGFHQHQAFGLRQACLRTAYLHTFELSGLPCTILGPPNASLGRFSTSLDSTSGNRASRRQQKIQQSLPLLWLGRPWRSQSIPPCRVWGGRCDTVPAAAFCIVAAPLTLAVASA